MHVLVTGATGFLGLRTCTWLKSRGFEVTGSGRNVELGRKLEAQGISFIPCDLTSASAAHELCQGIDAVVHSAALSSPWGKFDDFHLHNVVATQNLLAASVANAVGTFVHISTPSIYFDFRDRFEIAEDALLPKSFASHYSTTKYQAELEVKRTTEAGLNTIILRPRGIFGPGDTSIIPRIISAHRRGVLRIMGDGNNIVDLTHVDNVSHAICLALQASKEAYGSSYNITNGESVKLWDFIQRILAGVGLPPVTRTLPFAIGYRLGHFSELASTWLLGGREPMMTRYTVGLLAKSQTLDISKAKRALGYSPVIDMEAAVQSVINTYSTTVDPHHGS